MGPEQAGGFGHEVAVDASCCFPGFGVDDTGDGISFDEFAFSASGIAKRGGGEAVQVAQRSGGGFMEHGQRVCSDKLAVTACLFESRANVIGGVVWGQRREVKPRVNTRVQGAIATEDEPVGKFWQADEDKGQERPAVPLVVQQDVQMVQHVLVEQVGLVEKEDRVNTLTAEIFDVSGDGEKQGSGSGGRRKPQSEAELAIKIAAAEGSVVTVGEAEASLRQPVAQGTQDAGFASTWIAGEENSLFSLSTSVFYFFKNPFPSDKVSTFLSKKSPEI